MQEYLLSIPFIIFGGILMWIMIFLGVYSHFPRMEKQKRIAFSVTSATIMAVILVILLIIAMYFVMRMILP